MPVGTLTTVEIALIIGGVIAVCVVAVFYFWYQSKRPKRSGVAEQHDFVGRWIIYSGFVTLLAVIMYVVGFWDANVAKLVSGAAWIGFGFIYWRLWKGSEPLEMDEIRDAYALASLKEVYGVDKYIGGGTVDYVLWEKRSPSPTVFNPGRVVDTFLFALTDGLSVSRFLIKFDPQKRSKVFAMKNPDAALIYRELGEVVGESEWTSEQSYSEQVRGAGEGVGGG